MIALPIKPDVSVLIAAYNVERYIQRAIESALSQEGVNLEVIVIDDASSDQTSKIVSSFNDPRLRLLQNETNLGPALSRNAGIELAQASWIAVLDGDDALAPGRLRRCLDRAQQLQADIVIDLLEAVREEDGEKYLLYTIKDLGGKTTLDLSTFIRGNLSFLGKVSLGYAKPVFSKAFLDKTTLRYHPPIRIGEDYFLLASALAAGAVCAIEPSVGYFYTVRVGSISHRLAVRDIDLMIKGDKLFAERFQLDSSSKRALALRTFSLHEAKGYALLVDAFKAHDFFLALKLVLRRPSSLLHMWRPCWARLYRFKKRILP